MSASTRKLHDVEEAELWFVLLADDEVKRMTLEQLDDAYRLDIVDAKTRVWRPGMREWDTLGKVADLGRLTPTPRPNHASPHSANYASRARRSGSMPRAQLEVPLAVIPPIAEVQDSLRPLVRDSAADWRPPRQRGPLVRGILLGVAVVFSVCVSAYRNDWLSAAAQSLGFSPAYRALESSLGEPGFGTPRSVAELNERAPGALAAQVTRVLAAEEPAPAASTLTVPAAVPSTSTLPWVGVRAVAPVAQAPQASATANAPPAAAMSAALGARTAPSGSPRPSEARPSEARPSEARPSEARPSERRTSARPSAARPRVPGVTTPGDEWDPLNPSL
jgi:hypothetical protein